MRLGIAAALSFAATGGPVAAQDLSNLRGLVFFRGSCARLETPRGVWSADCLGSVVNMNYRTGRASFAFSHGNAAMVSFSGLNPVVNGDVGRLTLDAISIATNPGPRVDSEAATGTCEIRHEATGVITITCTGRTASGAFSGAFTSDGSMPEAHDF